jgi:hypothetical protein
MLRVFGDRMQCAVTEDRPSLPWFDPGPVEDAYNAMDPSLLAEEIDQHAQRLALIISERSAAEWSRTAMKTPDPRRPGAQPDSFTVAGLACVALHEAHHHLRDADGSLEKPSSRTTP